MQFKSERRKRAANV